jgi:hypothetical protein
MQDFHSKFFLELTDQLVQTWALEFDDLMAIQTGEMMVLRRPDRFVMLTLVVAGQVAPINESHFRQDSQGSVYRSQTDVRVLLTCPLEDAFGVQVFFSSFDYIEHDLALEGNAATAPPHSGKRFGMSSHGISLSLLLLQIILNNYSQEITPIQVKYIIRGNAGLHKPFCLPIEVAK